MEGLDAAGLRDELCVSGLDGPMAWDEGAGPDGVFALGKSRYLLKRGMRDFHEGKARAKAGRGAARRFVRPENARSCGWRRWGSHAGMRRC